MKINTAVNTKEAKPKKETKIRLTADQKHWLNLVDIRVNAMSFDFIERIYPSDANFLWIKVSEPNHLYQFLTSHKIIVRNRTKEIGCKGCLRLTIGMKKENLRLIEALNIYNPQIILK